jgi:hypothetical protein
MVDKTRFLSIMQIRIINVILNHKKRDNDEYEMKKEKKNGKPAEIDDLLYG